MMEKIFAVFGEKLPDMDTFFETENCPLSYYAMRSEYVGFANLCEEYEKFLAAKKAAPVTPPVGGKTNATK